MLESHLIKKRSAVMMDELEQLKSIIAEQDRRIQRMESVN